MDYSVLVETYEKLDKTTKRLEKTAILAELFDNTKNTELEEITLLLNGRVFPAWSEQKIGVASKYVLKAMVLASGVDHNKLQTDMNKIGDLGLVAEKVMTKKKQATLFSQKLTVKKVYSNIRKLADISGEGSVDRKVQLIAELLSHATPTEAKYVVRTALEVLRIGIGKGTIRDAIAWSIFPMFVQLFEKEYDEKTCKKIDNIEEIDKLNKKDKVVFVSDLIARENYNKLITAIDHAYHMTNDFAQVVAVAREKGYEGLMKVDIKPFRPVQVMLYKKAKDIKDAFNIVGKPAAFEYKYDGFRIECHKEKDKIRLYTRNFEDVTKQFPDVVDAVKKYVKCDSCIFDSEVVGFNKKTTQYIAFQQISQRIKRKYDIAETIKKLPVEVNVFDILFYDGKSVIDKPLHERRKILSKIIHPKERVIVMSRIMVSDNEKEANKFYNEALDKGNEGIMVKNLEAVYKPGSRVGFGVKVKPVMESLDLCIVGAEWGEGKRASWLTSFIVACRDDDDNLVTIGKVGTGIKELEGEGVTFKQLTEQLKDDIVEEKGKIVNLKGKLVIEVHYEEIQKSPTYTSGYALRFPRFIRLREDRGPHDCSTLEQIEEFYDEQRGRK
ncbi:DNA ligase [Candidatus Woesearchaeota archaeon CG10_big_fil_rev_8_21_14_0_10_34_8]|nr:MAG: DNA ligase [Candidatus Woesearchaeota archaeon CG10_big_fil_rev_8_21_14_0_10_34_8]